LPEFRPSTSAAAGGTPEVANDLERDAQGVLATAEARARALIVEAGREADALARRKLGEAFAAGRAEGIARGMAEGREAALATSVDDLRDELRRAAAVLVAAGERIARANDEALAAAEKGFVRLAVAVGAKLARRALTDETSPAALESIREALAIAADRAEVRVLVNPADAAALETAREAVRAEFPEVVRIAFEQDASVTPGGCRVVTASSDVDATLEDRAARIAEILAGRDAA
jgi:flagellar assembly protein FliH